MSSSHIKGTSLEVRFDRAVDGDTIKIYLPTSQKSESVRILCIDTEESSAFGSGGKPVTPWGKAAKSFAQSFFAATDTVTLEFPDGSPLDDALVKHRGTYGRLLVFVHKRGVDYSEAVIRKAYSPYYNKYGDAPFASHHRRYRAAERAAQAQGIGVWDQLTVNGAVRRPYPALTAWWALRAAAIERFRRMRRIDASLLDVREDYDRIVALARDGRAATVFTEVRDVRRTAAQNAVVRVGSRDRSFALFIPDVDDGHDAQGTRVVRLLRNRYVSDGAAVPRRSYCFVTGRLSLFRGAPQMVVSSPSAITDAPGARALDADEEADGEADGEEKEGEKKEETEGATAGDGANSGIERPQPPAVHSRMEDDDEAAAAATPARFPPISARIAAALPDPVGRDAGNEKIFVRGVSPDSDGSVAPGQTVKLDQWKVRDSGGRELRLDGVEVGVGQTVEVRVSSSRGSLVLRNSGDELVLLDKRGRIVDTVEYNAEDVSVGSVVDFDVE